MDEREHDDDAAAQRMVDHLCGFARGLGLDETQIREVVDAVTADPTFKTDEERRIEAWHRMIMVTA